MLDWVQQAIQVIIETTAGLELQSAAKALQTGNGSCEFLDALIARAYVNMTQGISVSAWQKMHTDASILRSLTDLSPLSALDAIRVLDSAIIISGATAEGRLDLILDLIKKIQFTYLFSTEISLSESILSSTAAPTPVLHPKQITCLDNPPSFVSFQNRYSHAPFILRDYARDWPALSRWKSIRYLRSIAGPGRIVPVEVGKDYRSDEWSQKLMPWDDFLLYLAQNSAEEQVLYLAQHNLFAQFPALRDDISPPDYIYTSLEAPDYAPPQNEDHLVMNIWLGPQGTISPAHTDPYFNFYAQVVGHKTVWLAPPDISRYMDPYTRDSPAMSNTSRIDVFSNAPESREFLEKVIPHAMAATLGPGDVLFFPPRWWHALRAETQSCSVSMWF